MTDRKTGLSIVSTNPVRHETKPISERSLYAEIDGKAQPEFGSFMLRIEVVNSSQAWKLFASHGTLSTGVAFTERQAVSRAKRAYREFLSDQHNAMHRHEVDQIMEQAARDREAHTLATGWTPKP